MHDHGTTIPSRQESTLDSREYQEVRPEGTYPLRRDHAPRYEITKGHIAPAEVRGDVMLISALGGATRPTRHPGTDRQRAQA